MYLEDICWFDGLKDMLLSEVDVTEDGSQQEDCEQTIQWIVTQHRHKQLERNNC